MLKVRPLEDRDYELINQAEEVIIKNYRYGRHHIGSAVRTTSGKVYSAVHVEANVGRITVCGEAMAIGKSISEYWSYCLKNIQAIFNNIFNGL
jgi:cytidine deaminase